MVLALLLVGCGTKKKLTNRYNNDTEITTSETKEKTKNITDIDSSTTEIKEVTRETSNENSSTSTEIVDVEEGTDIDVTGKDGQPITIEEEQTETGKKYTFSGAENVSISNTRRQLNKKIDELSERNSTLSQELSQKDTRIQHLVQQLNSKNERIVELEQSERSRTSDVETKGFRWWNVLWIIPVVLLVLAVRYVIRSRGKPLLG